jgi:hypothetical protein
VDGGDDPRLGIGQQNRRAVGGQDRAQQVGFGGDDGVALGPVALPGAVGDAGDGGMDLVAAVQMIDVGAEMDAGSSFEPTPAFSPS